MKKKIWVNFQRIIEFFTQKIVTKLSKVWVWDPGSEIRKKPISDFGSRGQKGTGSRIRIRNTGYRYNFFAEIKTIFLRSIPKKYRFLHQVQECCNIYTTGFLRI
jgi:hypothetical protein